MLKKDEIATRSRNENRILRLSEVIAITGLSSSTLWRLQRAGKFPLRRQLSPGAVGWIAREIQSWLDERDVVNGNVETVDYTECKPRYGNRRH